jgi:hypothetical protein
MQRLSFYRFNHVSSFSGNAEPLLLPLYPCFLFFGHCNGSAFTVISMFPLFQAMQSLSFYRFNTVSSFSGNASVLLLPLFPCFLFFGQCRRSPFTVLTLVPFFRAMQRFSFYRFNTGSFFSGNAEVLLLPI